MWKKSSDINAQSRIKSLGRELDGQKSFQFPCWSRVVVIQEQLGIAFSEEESFWRQNSRHKWLFGGDTITQFFQAVVESTRVRNSLSFLQDKNGNEHTLNKEKGKIASLFFENLFYSSYPANMTTVLEGFQSRVSQVMNQDLIRDVTEEEVYNAVFAMNSESAPGTDGFTALFFQKHWGLIKHQVMPEIFGFFQIGFFQSN